MSVKKGDILQFQIGEHIYKTPPVPKKKDILFHDLPKEKQYWKRQTDFPQMFYNWHRDGDGVETDADHTSYSEGGILQSLSIKDTITLFGDPTIKSAKHPKGEPEGLQLREFRRRTEGIWFYNNGEPTYLTGDHYAALQWFPMLGCDNEAEPGSNYGQYVQFQRQAFYWWEICEHTQVAVGGLMVKSKKTGITQAMALRMLNRACLVRQKTLRMMSTTESEAKETNFRFITYAMSTCPAIMLPSRAKQNEGEVIFGPPGLARNPLKKGRRTDIDYLHNRLCTVPTTRAGFDGVTNYEAWIDEWPKIKESTYPEELFTATIAAVKEGTKRKGTVHGTSYVPEVSNKSFYEGRKLYKESSLNTRAMDETGAYVGKTKSELIKFTLTVDEGIFGCCDIFGKPDEKKIYEFIRLETDKFKNDLVRLQAFKRQYPHNEQDPWQESTGEDMLFDNMRIGNKMIELEEMFAVGQTPYTDFNFEFETLPQKRKLGTEYDFPGRIFLKPVSDDHKRAGGQHGKFKWYHPEWTPDWFMNHHTNKRIKHPKTGNLMPDPNSPFFISIDPTNYKQRKMTKEGSKNAIQAFIMPTPELDTFVANTHGIGRVTEDRLFFEYLYREDKPSETLNDIIKIILYLNCPVQIECNMPTWAENLIEMGLGHFLLMISEETGSIEPWNPNRKQKYFTSQEQTIGWYVSAGREHLGEPTMPHHQDNIKFIDSYSVLEQLAVFKMENTKEFDAAVAYLQGIMGMKAWRGWKRAQDERKARRGDGSLKMVAQGLAR